MKQSGAFTREEVSVKKAGWMLLADALDALRDVGELLDAKRHRVAGRLFRDIIESIDTAAYLRASTPESERDLRKWHKNEVIPHRVSREFMQRHLGPEAAATRRQLYAELSKLTHRTYLSLAQGYIVGSGDRLVYEGIYGSGIIVPPQTISEYYAVLAGLIRIFVSQLADSGLVSDAEIDEAWTLSLEADSAPRRFVPSPPRRPFG